VKILNYGAGRVIRAIGTRFQLSVPEAAHLNLTFSLVNIPVAVVVSQLAATANSSHQFTAGFAVCAAAANFSY
jgi:hypothetical protein